MRKNSIRVLGIGMIVVVTLFLSFALSWGDTRLMVDQDTDGSLRATIWDRATQNTAVTGLPNAATSPIYYSCTVPSVDWDSTAGAWLLFAANDDGSMWSATISCTQTACTFTPNNYKNVACHLALPTPICLTSTGTYAGTVVNGQCNSTTTSGGPYTTAPTNLCSLGTPTTPTISGSQWTWTCQGSGTGATSATCNAAYSSGGGGGSGSGSVTQLTFGASTQSRNDTLAPGAEKIYVFTVPAGRTYFSANVSSIDQGTDLNILVEQGSMANIDTYYSNVYNYYVSKSFWGNSYFVANPPTVWARMSNSSAGENVYVTQSTSSPAADSAYSAAVLPGTYYMLVKNVSTCSTCKANYYVYAR